MNYVKERLKKDIECISVSKGTKRKYGFETLHTRIGSYDFQNSEDISKLFLDIRDEAHRFALKNFKSNKRKNLKKVDGENGNLSGKRRKQVKLWIILLHNLLVGLYRKDIKRTRYRWRPMAARQDQVANKYLEGWSVKV